MVLNSDFREFIKFLNENSVRYLVVGGYAVGFHGHPRYTKDLDVWIEASRENAENVSKALKEFGFDSVGLKIDDFLNTENFIQLGYPPNRIDIIMSCEGLSFAECFPRRNEIEIEQLKVNFLDYESLLKNKQSVGRPQDLADVSNLKPL
jgi:predicted nucleotidyltransferase